MEMINLTGCIARHCEDSPTTAPDWTRDSTAKLSNNHPRVPVATSGIPYFMGVFMNSNKYTSALKSTGCARPHIRLLAVRPGHVS
jgi:hypothetical protein